MPRLRAVTALDLALAGLGIGAIAALAGLGLLLTYRVTGVLNLAFGAIAMIAAYGCWQATRVWHWPVGLAGLVVIGGVCPLIGLTLERLVYRPLLRRAAAPAEMLVASLGALVLLVGIAVVVWGLPPRLDVPSLTPAGTVVLPGGTHLSIATLVELAVVAAFAAAGTLALRTTWGRQVRAVVEARTLAELDGIDADRVSAVGWVVGAMLAGTAGILLAPALRLTPYGTTLVVLETMAVVVVARLASVAMAIAAALAIGVAQAELTRVHLSGRAGSVLSAVTANLFVVALLVAVIVVRRLQGDATNDLGATAPLARRGLVLHRRGWWIPAAVTLAAPMLFNPADLHTALQVPALALIVSPPGPRRRRS